MPIEPRVAARGIPVVTRRIRAGWPHKGHGQGARADPAVDAEGAGDGVPALGAAERDEACIEELVQ